MRKKNRGQRTVRMTNLRYLPPTVNDHTERSDGLTLHTIDPDPDTDIEVYDDERESHLSGNPPEGE